MELDKLCEEFASHVRGNRKRRFFRFEQRPDGGRSFRLYRGTEADVPALKSEFLEFIARFPYDRAMQRASSFELRNEQEDIALILGRLAAALSEKTGLSFVRMGDGEGRFVGPAREFPHLFRQSKLIASDIWYKYSAKPKDSFYDAMEAAYANASIVGYVPAFRVDLEARNIWYGYVGCVSGNEFIHASYLTGPSRSTNNLVRNWTNVHLAKDEDFAKLLRRARVCVITCHAQKDAFLEGFGLEDIEHIVIAPEAHPLLANRSVHARLYPDQYLEILEGLESSDSGVYLIGAGVYAKIFCERLRQLGKIGLDLGSELDRIAGIETRAKR